MFQPQNQSICEDTDMSEHFLEHKARKDDLMTSFPITPSFSPTAGLKPHACSYPVSL